MRRFTFLFLCFCFLFSSCEKARKKKEIARLVSEWQGKEIQFPQDIVFTRYINDTLHWKIPEADHKVLVYVDHIGCLSCALQLPQWKKLIAQTDSLTGGTVPFLFFFASQRQKDIRNQLIENKFDYPVCLDTQDQLNALNRFPSKTAFQTFLLDKQNHVVLIGNPVHNVSIKDLYLAQITSSIHSTPSAGSPVQTTVGVESVLADLGTFSSSEKRTGYFTLKNTGSQPLVVLDAATTCGCAAVSYDSRPARPGESLQVKVEMSPKETGAFHETITVKCNTDRPIHLKITGLVTP